MPRVASSLKPVGRCPLRGVVALQASRVVKAKLKERKGNTPCIFRDPRCDEFFANTTACGAAQSGDQADLGIALGIDRQFDKGLAFAAFAITDR